jgi:hypothetical protein
LFLIASRVIRFEGDNLCQVKENMVLRGETMSNNASGKMGGTVVALLVTLATAGTAPWWWAKVFPEPTKAPEVGTAETPAQASERELRVAAAQMSAQMPYMWGENLRADSVAVGPGLRLAITLTTLLVKGADATGSARPQSIQNVKAAVCADPATRFLLSNGVAVTYKLRGTDLVQILSIDLTLSDCH